MEFQRNSCGIPGIAGKEYQISGIIIHCDWFNYSTPSIPLGKILCVYSVIQIIFHSWRDEISRTARNDLIFARLKLFLHSLKNELMSGVL